MSIEYSAAIVLGLPFNDLPQTWQDRVRKGGEPEDLQVFPPYYDAPIEDCVVGYSALDTDSYSWKFVPASNPEANDNAARFERITGIEPRAILTVIGN